MGELLYEVTGRVARLTLNRPARGNGLTRDLLVELESAVERADLDPEVRALLISGSGKGFCGGYDLIESAEGLGAEQETERAGQPGTPLDPHVIAANHEPQTPWDPMVDYAMMSRNVRSFTALMRCSKPVVCKVHGFCVAGGTDLALCADLLVISSDAKIGYPPARVWGVPTTALWAYRLGPQRAKRLLFTGDCLSGAEALHWGLAIDAPHPNELDERTEALLDRIVRLPLNQLQMMKLLVDQALHAQGLHGSQLIGTLLDGVARHTREGYAFQASAAREGFRAAVRARDEPFASDPASHPGSPDGVVAKSSDCDFGGRARGE